MAERINWKACSHFRYLLFWPIFGLRYILIERFIIPAQYHEIFFPLDDIIPFCEGFLIPYLLWYVFFIGMHVYVCFRDAASFRRYTRYLIVAFSISTLTFLIFPTCQNLRPAEFPRENLLTGLVQLLYLADTNTNVCPSEHVIGSVGAFLAAVHTKNLRRPWVIAVFAVVAFFTSIATVFLKQHSVIDVFAALPVCAVGYWFGYRKKDKN